MPPLSDADKAEVAEIVKASLDADEFKKGLADTINSAVTGHTKRLSKSLGDDMAKRLEDAVAKLKPADPPEGDAGKATGGGDGKTSATDAPELRGLQRQIAELKAQADAAKAEAAAERAKQRDGTLRQRLTDALVKGGVDAPRARQAVMVLVDGEKRVKWSDGDDDRIVFADTDGDVDFETGVKGWLKSDDAKIYLPPRGTQGSGDRGGGRAPASAPNAPPPGTIGAWLDGLTQGGPNPLGG